MPIRPVSTSVNRISYLCSMDAYDILDNLKALVSKFLDRETYHSPSASLGSLKRDLEVKYESSVKGIIKDIENEYDFLYQQDCDITIDAFKQDMRAVQERAEPLKAMLEEAKEMPADGGEDMERMKIQAEFCERLIVFIESLIEKVQALSESALTSKEANDCFFEDVRVEEEDLPQIYNNLVERGWMSGRRTSFKDFLYYFTGKGFRPAKPILWKNGQDELCLFIEEMTFDIKDLTKAVLIFEKSGYELKSRNLSSVRSRINNQRPLDKENKLRVMYRDIFEFPNWKELAKAKAFDY